MVLSWVVELIKSPLALPLFGLVDLLSNNLPRRLIKNRLEPLSLEAFAGRV